MTGGDPRHDEKEWPQYRTIKERRAANQKAWANNPASAVFRAEQEHKAKLDFQAEITSVLKGAPSLTKLRHIMASADLPLHRRIEAAETIIGYELGPGAAAGIEPDEVAADSYRFLRAATEAPDVPESLMFRALKAIAHVENARAAIKNAGDALTTKRQALLDLVNSTRRQWLIANGRWPADRSQWWLASDDVIDWPAGWPGIWMWPLATIAARYARRKQLPAFHAMLANIRATNREDQWQLTERIKTDAGGNPEVPNRN